ncbi:MAG: hypothetical protein LBP41_03090 [Holosporaceae bacterium]|jgi:hypothetical protein|nr:hypothetical protein [Holosporaceae bacterium]
MIPLKNNVLKILAEEKLCETHNGKKNVSDKIKLSTHKAYDYGKIYHPLKNKRIRLHRLKFVNAFCGAEIYDEGHRFAQESAVYGRKISRRRYKVVAKKKWATVDEIMNWLASVGVEVKYGTEGGYIIGNRKYSLNHMMIFANKKRIDFKLEPFYVDGVTEF